ncbi:MAG: O-antigen ligase family protein [Opitutaceae bacterium]|jgi:MYXO-CTERM domain-containing protein
MLTALFGDRFDFLGLGPASTNQSAVVLACALVSCGWLGLRSKHHWQIAGLLIGTALTILLVATKSRGGLIAATCGLGLLAAVARPRFPRWAWASLLVVVGLVITYGTIRGVWGRFTYGDDSRRELWRAGLAMLWDAPHGWGVGNTPSVFAQWYQEIGDRRGYLSLINFHLTWLAEHGLVARIGYALSWAGLCWLVWPTRRANPAGPAVPPYLVTAAGVWLAFFVAAIFSTTASVWQVWALPLAWLVAALAWRIRRREWAGPLVALRVGGAALVVLGALHVVGWRLSDGQLVEGGSQIVRWGDAKPSFVLYDPNPDVLGNKWGQDVREQSDSVWVLYPTATISLPADSQATWILSGNVPDKLPPKSRVCVLNMPASPELLHWLQAQMPSAVEVVLSDSLCDALKCATWSEWAAKDKRVTLRVMGGTGLYVPNWMP